MLSCLVPFRYMTLFSSIQDPNDMEKRNISDFHYIKEGLSIKDEEEEDATKNINAVGTTQKVLQALASVRTLLLFSFNFNIS